MRSGKAETRGVFVCLNGGQSIAHVVHQAVFVCLEGVWAYAARCLKAVASLAARECPSPLFLMGVAKIGHSRAHFGGWRATPSVSRMMADISPLLRR